MHALLTHQSVHDWVSSSVNMDTIRWPALPLAPTGCKDIEAQWNKALLEIHKINRPQQILAPSYAPWRKSTWLYPLRDKTVELREEKGKLIVTPTEWKVSP